MAEIGLQEISPWNWQHEVLREKEEPMTINLKEAGKRWKKNKDKVNHRLREAWRWKEWTKAGQKETKVGKLISKVPYHQDLYRRAKRWIQIPERKCLLAAGFTSPAELKMNRNAPPNWPTTCPWCGKEPGRTLHMLWECKSRPHGGPT